MSRTHSINSAISIPVEHEWTKTGSASHYENGASEQIHDLNRNLPKDTAHPVTGKTTQSGLDATAYGGEQPILTEYLVYKRRWFGLFQLVLLNVIVSWDVRTLCFWFFKL